MRKAKPSLKPSLHSFVAIAIVACVFAGRVEAQGPDNSSIPPDILKRMNPDIVSGARPKVAFIKQADIFGLREKGRLAADLVRFDFHPSALSTAQRTVLDAWLRAGNNRVTLEDEDLVRYAELFGLSGNSVFPCSSDSGKVCHLYEEDKAKAWVKTQANSSLLTLHAVTTDAKIVTFGSYAWEYGNACYPVFCRQWSISEPPDDRKEALNFVVLAHRSDAPAHVLCGAFTYGKCHVVFSNKVSGPDVRRWNLNFLHFALDLPIPGAVDPLGVPDSGIGRAETYDRVTLKNGDKVTGTILNETLTIKTSYATLTIDREKVDTITFEGAGANIDELLLRTGDKLSGVIDDAKIKVRLSSGADATLDKDKIKEIRILKLKQVSGTIPGK